MRHFLVNARVRLWSVDTALTGADHEEREWKEFLYECVYICLYVYICLSVSISQKPHVQTLPTLLRLLPTCTSVVRAYSQAAL